jgi:2-polyprenyl-3-methyl-5-hydroxy-6-metoxy-1,4-benzoquinol methylase
MSQSEKYIFIGKDIATMTDPRILFFDRHAAQWDTYSDPQVTLERLNQLSEPLKLNPGMDLLEVGCGTGQITQWLADRVRPGRVWGLDFSARMLEKARTKGITAEFIQGDVCDKVPGDRPFDTVLCFHSFPHFRDPFTALKNLAAALKTQGQLLILHLAGSREINRFHTEVGGPVAGDHLPEAGEWDVLLSRAGLRKLELIDQADLFFLRAGLD